MILLQIIRALAVLGVLPYMVGMFLLQENTVIKQNCIHQRLTAFLLGNAAMWGLFELIAVPNILGQNGLIVVLCAWLLILVLYLGVKIYRAGSADARQILLNDFKNQERNATGDGGRAMALGNSAKILRILAAVIVLCIIGIYLFGISVDRTESRTVAHAVIAFESNRMVIDDPVSVAPNLTGWAGEFVHDAISPFCIYLAGLAKFSGIEPTIWIRCIYGPYLVVLSAISLFLMFRECFAFLLRRNGRAMRKSGRQETAFETKVGEKQAGDTKAGKKRRREKQAGETEKKCGIYALAVAACVELLHLAVLWLGVTGRISFQLRMWQGKYVLVLVILPFLLMLILQYLRFGTAKDGEKTFGFVFLLTSLAACLCWIAGLAAAGCCIIFTGLVLLIRTRNRAWIREWMLGISGTVVFGLIYYLLHIGQMVS